MTGFFATATHTCLVTGCIPPSHSKDDARFHSASGRLDVPHAGNTWALPSIPATIAVPAVQFTRTTSVAVTLAVTEGSDSAAGSTTAWFDGLRLEPLIDGAIFADGFD